MRDPRETVMTDHLMEAIDKGHPCQLWLEPYHELRNSILNILTHNHSNQSLFPPDITKLLQPVKKITIIEKKTNT